MMQAGVFNLLSCVGYIVLFCDVSCHYAVMQCYVTINLAVELAGFFST